VTNPAQRNVPLPRELAPAITDPPQRELKPITRQATSEELKKRLENRVKFHAIISAKYGHNEMLLAYRSHDNPVAFPMFTDFISKEATPEDEKYRVVTSDGNPTGQWLTGLANDSLFRCHDHW
jgi:hypothetical protein